MTTLARKEIICSVCGFSSEQTCLGSTNSFGYCDLDFRPPEMERSTMEYWMQECPQCGYVASSLDEPSLVDSSFLKSDEYLLFPNEDLPKSELTKQFIKQARIFIKADDLFAAINFYICGAWDADDNEDNFWSKEARLKAIQIMDELARQGEGDENLDVRKADLLRKSDNYERVIEEYKDFRSEDDVLNSIIAFQIEKAKEKDSKTYTVGDVVGDDKR